MLFVGRDRLSDHSVAGEMGFFGGAGSIAALLGSAVHLTRRPEASKVRILCSVRSGICSLWAESASLPGRWDKWDLAGDMAMRRETIEKELDTPETWSLEVKVFDMLMRQDAFSYKPASRSDCPSEMSAM